jgi:cytidine deaminase
MKKLTIHELSAEDRELVQEAEESRNQAYTPYSKYKVGAAVKADSGEVFSGCNVEIATYHATHAERNALDTMVAQGGRRLITLAVVAEGESFPCAECRQAIWEFCGGNLNVRILGADTRGNIVMATIGELYPEPFGPMNLGVNSP